MKLSITAIALALFAFGSTAAYAAGCAKHHCQKGYTYSKDAGTCVKVSISS